MSVLKQCKEYDAHTLEAVLSVRILKRLGYVAPESVDVELLRDSFPFGEITKLAESDVLSLRKVIETGLTESQL